MAKLIAAFRNAAKSGYKRSSLCYWGRSKLYAAGLWFETQSCDECCKQVVKCKIFLLCDVIRYNFVCNDLIRNSVMSVLCN
jgi:hypothetical protein